MRGLFAQALHDGSRPNLPSPLWGGSTADAKRRRAGWGSQLLRAMCPPTTTPTPNPSPQELGFT